MVIDVNALIEIRNTEKKGRGVFAKKDFSSGSLIERVPVLVFPKEEVGLIEKTLLYNYIFAWKEEASALALGNGSLYNHSYFCNARYFKNYDHQYIDFVAYKEIKTGEEITINYNGDPLSLDPIWFEVAHDK